jgi:hypothetical protein
MHTPDAFLPLRVMLEFALSACRVAVPVQFYVFGRDSGLTKYGRVIALDAQRHEQFLIAEVRRFLKHQPVCPEQIVIDRQSHIAEFTIRFFEPEAVLAVPRVREDSHIPELQNWIPCHRSVPFLPAPDTHPSVQELPL